MIILQQNKRKKYIYVKTDSGRKNYLTLYQTTKKLVLTKLKAFSDDKCHFAKMMTSVFDRVENIMGKGEKFNAGYHNVTKSSLVQRLSDKWLTLSQTSLYFYVSAVQVF